MKMGSLGSLKVVSHHSVDHIYNILLAFHALSLCYFRDIVRYWPKIANFSCPHVFDTFVGNDPFSFHQYQSLV